VPKSEAEAKMAVVPTDKWEGEDEDDDIKDSWDKESDDEDSKSSDGGKAVQRKKKKKLADILAEKEATKMTDAEKKAAELEAKKAAETPEGKLAEKMRRQKLDEIENLQIAKEMMGKN
jgi:translation initiation factor 3 subunit J